MRTSTAFFAGAGTVIMVVAGGLGGGLMIANTMNPKAPAAQTSKLERRASEPSPSPSPSPHAGAVQAAATPPAKDLPAQPPRDTASIQASTPSKPQSSAVAATNAPAVSEPRPAPSPSPSQATQRDAHDKPGAPDSAFAKAREADLKTPDAETKRTAQKRQTRQHPQWAERRRMQRQPEPDLREVEQAARDDDAARRARDDDNGRSYSDDGAGGGYRTENRVRVYPDDGYARRYQDGRGRDYAAEPVELDLPRVRLFDGF
jgi:hypothetical protein